MSSIIGINTSTVNTNTYTNKVDTKKTERAERTATNEAVKDTSTQAENTVATNANGDTLQVNQKPEEKTSKKLTQEELSKIMKEAEQDARQFTNFINKVMGNQGKNSIIANYGKSSDEKDSFELTLDDLTDSVGALKEGLENGTIQVDQETIDKAKELTSENGYYGVKQTSERILDFAKAISGGDTSKADILKDAIQKGFDSAAELWGGMDKAPQITKDTYDAVMKGFDEWVNGASTQPTTATK